MDQRELLRRCRIVLARHYPISYGREIEAIDAAMAMPAPGWPDVEIERIALATEAPVGTVARILRHVVAPSEVLPALPPIDGGRTG